jgi:hypothetical protein
MPFYPKTMSVKKVRIVMEGNTEKGIVQNILGYTINKITRPLCDLNTIFKDIHVLRDDGATKEKEGISDSVKMFTTLKEDAARRLFTDYIKDAGRNYDNVFVKIGFRTHDDNSIEFEHSMYAYLRQLLRYNRTPNIMLFAGSFVCEDFHRYMDYLTKTFPNDNDVKELIKQVQKIKAAKPALNTNIAYILIVEKGKGKDLYKCLEDKELSRRDLIKILFQIFYTIHQIHLAKVNLNDLHLGNIWINILDEPVNLVYFINDDVYYKMSTRYIVKIFDFDKSTFTIDSIRNMKMMEWCEQFGACTVPDERRDIFKVLGSLYPPFFGQKIDNEGLISTLFRKVMVETIVKDPKFTDPKCCRVTGIPCEKIRDDKGREICDPNFVIPQGSVLNFLEICHLTLMFESMRRTLTYDGYQFDDLPIYYETDKDEVPLYAFDHQYDEGPVHYVYFSLDCKLSPMEFANKLLRIELPSPPSPHRPAELDTGLGTQIF